MTRFSLYILPVFAMGLFLLSAPVAMAAQDLALQIEPYEMEPAAGDAGHYHMEEKDVPLISHGVHEADHHGEHAEVEGLPQLDATTFPSQIFWLAILFAVLYIPFRYRVIPDIRGIVERRSEVIENDLTSAQALKTEAEALIKDYENILAEARDKSSALFERAENKIKDKEQEEYQAFLKQASIEVEQMEEEIAKAKEDALGDVNDIAAEIASLAAQKITGLETDQGQALKFVETIGKKKAA